MKIGLVLSGGGARGIAHLGILRALEELHIPFHCVSGTSVGAIIGAMYAQGMRPDEILEAVLHTKILRTLRPAWTLRGLLSIESVQSLLTRYIPHNTFEALRIPLTVVATDLGAGKPHYFSSGPLAPALMASSCVPGMFNPIAVDGATYVDGGITDNFPAMALRANADYVIGLHCNPVIEAPPVKSVKTVLERTMLLAINCNAARSKEYCDLVIEPPDAGTFSTLDVSRARELADLGYAYAREFLTPERLTKIREAERPPTGSD